MLITNTNFVENLPLIKNAVSSADAIAIDFEFSGSLKRHTHNPFDSVSERFSKEVDNLDPSCIFELGICCLSVQPDQSIQLTPFDMYVFQQYSKHLKNDQFLQFSTATLAFLQEHGLDLQKWTQEGVSFLTPQQEESLRSTLVKKVREKKREPSLFNSTDAQFVEELKQKLIKLANDDSQEVLSFENLSPFHRFLVHNTVSSCYPHWRTATEDKNLLVYKLDANEAEQYDARMEESRNNQINSLVGVRLIFDLISRYKKPLVIHGGLADLLLICKVFYGINSPDLDTFKKFIHSNFPIVYDTAFIAQSLGIFPRLSLSEVFKKSCTLNDGYRFSIDGIHGFTSLINVVNGDSSDFVMLNLHRPDTDALLAVVSCFILSKVFENKFDTFKNFIYCHKLLSKMNVGGDDIVVNKDDVFGLRSRSFMNIADVRTALKEHLCCDVEVYHFFRSDFIFIVEDPQVYKRVCKLVEERAQLTDDIQFTSLNGLDSFDQAAGTKRLSSVSEGEQSTVPRQTGCFLM
ncbi:hypothetical protein P9112_012594 [Eukaryota sp. TZLM1-RC]